ncbi:MAG TPA: metallophosphoesterase [Gammaproteobacteria bacterium]|nr:metallophosphoesterase [Gammaproteobacteria bacterium]
MRLAWVTDIHLNFLDKQGRTLFYQKILNSYCDALLISGDIAEAPCLIDILVEMVEQVKKPIYFILGNHDYYRGHVSEVRAAATALTETHGQLFWLPASGIRVLNNHTILLGQDGWADGRWGSYENSNVALNDSRLIADLFQAKVRGKFQLLKKMQELADMDAMQLQNDLDQAINKNPKRIIVLTHVPPFKEACIYNGQMSDENWLPYFSSKVMGDLLKRIAEQNPLIEFLILCGHTHSKSTYKPLDNLIINVGYAEYYQPEIQETQCL